MDMVLVALRFALAADPPLPCDLPPLPEPPVSVLVVQPEPEVPPPSVLVLPTEPVPALPLPQLKDDDTCKVKPKAPPTR